MEYIGTLEDFKTIGAIFNMLTERCEMFKQQSVHFPINKAGNLYLELACKSEGMGDYDPNVVNDTPEQTVKLMVDNFYLSLKQIPQLAEEDYPEKSVIKKYLQEYHDWVMTYNHLGREVRNTHIYHISTPDKCAFFQCTLTILLNFMKNNS